MTVINFPNFRKDCRACGHPWNRVNLHDGLCGPCRREMACWDEYADQEQAKHGPCPCGDPTCPTCAAYRGSYQEYVDGCPHTDPRD